MELEQFRSQVLTEEGRSALHGLRDPDLLVGEFFWQTKQQAQRGDVETYKAILWCFEAFRESLGASTCDDGLQLLRGLSKAFHAPGPAIVPASLVRTLFADLSAKYSVTREAGEKYIGRAQDPAFWEVEKKRLAAVSSLRFIAEQATEFALELNGRGENERSAAFSEMRSAILANLFDISAVIHHRAISPDLSKLLIALSKAPWGLDAELRILLGVMADAGVSGTERLLCCIERDD